jgi:hypothetical protein
MSLAACSNNHPDKGNTGGSGGHVIGSPGTGGATAPAQQGNGTDPDSETATGVGAATDAGPHSALDASFGSDAGSKNPGVDGGAACTHDFQEQQTPICAGVCGNGTLDSCASLCATPGPCPMQQEQCDQAMPDGVTCETLGYAGGQLACTPWCMFDETECLACVAPHGQLIACERPCVDGAEGGLVAVAVTSDTIGAAWTTAACTNTGCVPGSTRVHFAGFDSKLRVIFDAPSPGNAANPQVALAHSSTQWLLAVPDESGITIYGFDDKGKALGKHTIADGRDPAFGIQPNAAPLLVWTIPSSNPSENGVRQAAVLTDDGDLATKAVTLWPSPESRVDALFVGDGFLIAQRGGNAIHTAHVALSGALLSSTAMPLGDGTESPSLVPIGQQVGITYFDYSTPSAVVKWAVLDKDGNVATDPVPLSPQPQTSPPDVYAVLSNDTGLRLLASSSTPPYELTVTNLDLHGQLSPNPLVIAKSASGFSSPVLAKFGDNAVAAWIEGSVLSSNTVKTLYLALVSLQ